MGHTPRRCTAEVPVRIVQHHPFKPGPQRQHASDLPQDQVLAEVAVIELCCEIGHALEEPPVGGVVGPPVNRIPTADPYARDHIGTQQVEAELEQHRPVVVLAAAPVVDVDAVQEDVVPDSKGLVDCVGRLGGLYQPSPSDDATP